MSKLMSGFVLQFHLLLLLPFNRRWQLRGLPTGKLTTDIPPQWQTNLLRPCTISSFQYRSFTVLSGAWQNLEILMLFQHGSAHYLLERAWSLSTSILLQLQMSLFQATVWPKKFINKGELSCKNCAAIQKMQSRKVFSFSLLQIWTFISLLIRTVVMILG